jgi:glycosyltransferase involved in cell wall biosynthesis
VAALAAATEEPVFTRVLDRTHPLERSQDEPALWTLGLPMPDAPVFRDTWCVPEVARALEALLQKEPVDLIHVHHLAHLGLEAMQPLVQAGLPVVLSLHDYHLPCVRGQLLNRHLEPCPGPETDRCGRCVAEHLRASPGLHRLGRIAARLGIRAPARRLASLGPPGSLERDRIESRMRAARAVLTQADLVLSPSQDLAQRMVALGWADPDRMQVVDLPLLSPIPPASDPGEGPLRFLFLGSLIPPKGADVLLKAFSGLEEGEISFFGPCPDYDGQPGWAERLCNQISQTPRARYGGVFNQGERRAVLEAADVLVVPSLWEENSPLVVREAQAAGLRVVASAKGGIGEIAPEARFVPAGNPTALRAALRQECREGRGRRSAVDRPMKAHVEILTALYRDVLASRSPHPVKLH